MFQKRVNNIVFWFMQRWIVTTQGKCVCASRILKSCFIDILDNLRPIHCLIQSRFSNILEKCAYNARLETFL